ncbi:hypothetical protein ES707_16110 [subsurface metagenome]
MKSLTSMSTGSISILLPVYSYEPVLVSYRFLYMQQVYPISIFLKSNFLEKTWHFNPILVYSIYIF